MAKKLTKPRQNPQHKDRHQQLWVYKLVYAGRRTCAHRIPCTPQLMKKSGISLHRLINQNPIPHSKYTKSEGNSLPLNRDLNRSPTSCSHPLRNHPRRFWTDGESDHFPTISPGLIALKYCPLFSSGLTFTCLQVVVRLGEKLGKKWRLKRRKVPSF